LTTPNPAAPKPVAGMEKYGVEEVEELGPELDAHSFADASFLEDGEVKVLDSRSAQYGIDPRLSARARSPAALRSN